MADLLAPGLWWLHETRGSNVFLLEADDGSMALVDTGFSSSIGGILRELDGLGAHGRVTRILLTHRHFDHVGAARAIREQTGAKVVAGRADCYEANGQLYLRAMSGRTHMRRLWRRGGAPRLPEPVDIGLEAETEVLPGVVAIPTPGHTAGSYCFLLKRAGAVFVGDLVISHKGELTRSMKLANEDDALYLQTLKEFAEDAPEAGLPGHGVPVMAGFGEQLRGLAALPRSGGGLLAPWRLVTRVRRLVHFNSMMTRTRRGG